MAVFGLLSIGSLMAIAISSTSPTVTTDASMPYDNNRTSMYLDCLSDPKSDEANLTHLVPGNIFWLQHRENSLLDREYGLKIQFPEGNRISVTSSPLNLEKFDLPTRLPSPDENTNIYSLKSSEHIFTATVSYNTAKISGSCLPQN
jgi:hypothetical protein